MARSDCYCGGRDETELEEKDQEDRVDLIYVHEVSSIFMASTFIYLLLIYGESHSFMH